MHGETLRIILRHKTLYRGEASPEHVSHYSLTPDTAHGRSLYQYTDVYLHMYSLEKYSHKYTYINLYSALIITSDAIETCVKS